MKVQFLKEHYFYDEKTGLFTIRKLVSKFSHCKVGSVLGLSQDSGKYVTIRVNGKKYKAHRLAWLYVYGSMPKGDIDHINHCRNDNRIDNLRIAYGSDNMKNKTIYKNNKSGVFGVYWYKQTNKWKAEIRVEGVTLSLGYFHKFSEAVDARKNAEALYGFHKNHGIGENKYDC